MGSTLEKINCVIKESDIQNKYFDFFKKHIEFPVLIVDVSEVDFVNQSSVFQQLVNI